MQTKVFTEKQLAKHLSAERHACKLLASLPNPLSYL